jgi:hypothetical protein
MVFPSIDGLPADAISDLAAPSLFWPIRGDQEGETIVDDGTLACRAVGDTIASAASATSNGFAHVAVLL